MSTGQAIEDGSISQPAAQLGMAQLINRPVNYVFNNMWSGQSIGHGTIF
jgi:hypothetical protein